MKNNIPWKTLVRDIQIHPVTNDLILATHGRGIIIVDNITPMRNMTKEVADEEIHFFDPKPITITMGKHYIGSGSGDGYVGRNTSQQAPIEYYFKDRVNTGQVTVEIYDKNGRLVQSMPGSKRKGINIVYWNMRGTPPKVAGGGAKMDGSGFTAPIVLPGEYTVKIKMADKYYEKKLVMQRSENDNMTLADMEQRYNTAMQLYAMHERLAALVDSIGARQQMLKEYRDKIKTVSVRSTLQEYNDKLETLRSKLLNTKQKSIFADEKKLREDISEVYSAVCYQETRPSNLQLERVKGLQKQLEDAEKTDVAINNQYFEKVKTALLKEKLDKIKSKSFDKRVINQ